MSLIDDVGAQLKEAMLARDKQRTSTLRSIRAAFIDEMKSDGSESLTDARALACVQKLAKQRRESIEAYRTGAREDLAVVEEAELVVIASFLPQQADEATARQWVAAAIAATDASSMRELGKVMAHLTAHHKDMLDMKQANAIARGLLAG